MREPFRRARSACAAAAAAMALMLVGCASGTDTGRPHGTAASRRPHSAPASPTASQDGWNPHPASVAALGDSITRGFDACSLLADCPEVSWATGTRAEVDSLTARLLSSRQGAALNYAASGARMADLRDQAARAARDRPGLVTVLMGANDACRPSATLMTPVETFRAQFTAAMDTLRRGSPDTEVYVASVPDLRRLWDVGRGSPLARQVWALGVCPSILASPDADSPADTARRDAVRARVVAYNDVLREVCGRYPRCRYDGGAVFNAPFGTDELSPWDWFHPSARGQARLARLAYAGIEGR